MFYTIGIYYIDIFSIIFILQIIYIVLCYKNNINKNSIILMLGIFTGIATAIKVTNLIIISPILIWSFFVLKPNKESVKYIIISVLFFLIPVLIYAIDNYKQTGSILFPYYNNIFRSNYFGYFSWVEPRFGIHGILKAIIWPVYVNFYAIGYGDDTIISSPIWAIGYISTLIYLFYCIIKKQINTTFKIAIISIIITAFWIIFLKGYMRYALVIPVLYCIVISSILLSLLNKLKTPKISFENTIILFGVCFILFFINISFSKKIFKGSPFFDIENNTSLILQDYATNKIHIDGVWGTICDSSGLAVLVREPNTPIINLDKSTIETSNVTLNMYNNLAENKSIYILIEESFYEYKIKALEENNFELGELVKTYTYNELPFLDINETVYLYKLNYINTNT